MRVGFVGLGSQGAPMARRIVDAGYPTTLWARRPASLEPFADTGARIAFSLAELAASSDLVCVCVVDDTGVEEVVNGILDDLPSGGIIAVHSTVHPDTCRRLAERAAEGGTEGRAERAAEGGAERGAARGVALVDAPVSGGGIAAAEGRLLVMVGGEPDAVEACRPVFATYADPIVHMGPVGAGQVTKLLNNLLFTANLATAATTLTLGQQLAVDPTRLAEVIAHGTANSFALGRIASAGGTLERIATHAGGLLRKDVRLMTELTDAAQADGGIVLTAAGTALDLMTRSTAR